MPTDRPEKSKDKDEIRPRNETAQPHDNKIAPADEKIPEGAGNLRRRAEWFQKRTGSKQ